MRWIKLTKRILIVDDDTIVLNVFKNILQEEGYAVDTAETGGAAIVKSETRYYNLALLDIRLPDIEGTELLTRMHRMTPKMMKIMITGYPSQDNAIESLNRGADAYIVKPVQADELIRVVEEKLREQGEVEQMSQEQVTEWIKTRIQKLEQYKIE